MSSAKLSSSVLTSSSLFLFFFFFNDPATTEIYTLSLHDALPISPPASGLTARQVAEIKDRLTQAGVRNEPVGVDRSEEHTSELQSRENLVCRLLLEKKKKKEEVKDSNILNELAHALNAASSWY